MNKWDLVEKDSKTVKRFQDRLRMDAKFLSFAPILTISALTGLRILKIFSMVEEIYQQYEFRIGTGQLNKIFEQAIQKNEPSLVKPLKIDHDDLGDRACGARAGDFFFVKPNPQIRTSSGEHIHFPHKRLHQE